MRQSRLVKSFIYSTVVILSFTATAKIVSGFGNVEVLEALDPILGIKYRSLLWNVALIEIVVALFCLIAKDVFIKTVCVSSLSTMFLTYRFGLFWVNYRKPCSCMGSLTEMLHISPEIADMVMKIILAYLIIGSYATLFWLWRHRGQAEGRMQNDEVKSADSSELGVGG
jgi:hypothetical protein